MTTKESAPARWWADIKKVVHTVWFWIAETTLTLTTGFLNGPSTAVIVFLMPLALLCLVIAARTPYRQRNEARAELQQLRGSPDFSASYDFFDDLSGPYSILLMVENQGEDTEFEAQLIGVSGIFEEPAPPWSVPWRHSNSEMKVIRRNSQAAIHLAKVDRDDFSHVELVTTKESIEAHIEENDGHGELQLEIQIDSLVPRRRLVKTVFFDYQADRPGYSVGSD